MSIDDPTVRDQVARALRDCHITSSDYDGHEIADALAEAGLLRPDLVWLDPQPVVPRPEPEAQRVEAAKIDLMISDQLGEPRDPQMTALAEGTKTEVDWRYITREAWTSCGDDERQARALAARFGGTVQSRTVTAWTNA